MFAGTYFTPVPMKGKFICIPVLCILMLACQGFTFPRLNKPEAAIRLFSAACDSIPELNKKIVGLVKQQIGNTVDRGECWDLAALVLNRYDATWDKKYVFGRKVDPAKDCVYPGDIIQFEGVTIKYKRGNAVFTETMGHHTAVIYEVKSQGVYVLAHQNTGTSGRKVGLSDLDLKTIVKGKYQIYRPVI
jgi:hypothetical protein